MDCPNCGTDRLKFGRQDKNSDIRWYTCLDCGEKIVTDEVRVVFNGEKYVPAKAGPVLELPPIPPEAKKKKRDPSPVVERMRVVHVPADHWGLTPSIARDVKYWWEQSRWLKHGGKAVWSERAFLASLRRLKTLHDASPADAVKLIEEAVEKGWQALDPRYMHRAFIDGKRATVAAVVAQQGPKDPAMQSALAEWKGQN